MTEGDATLILRLEVLSRKLDEEGRYVSRNTVDLAIDRIRDVAAPAADPGRAYCCCRCDHCRLCDGPSLWSRIKAFAFDIAARLAPIAAAIA